MDPLAFILLGVCIFVIMMLTLVYPKTGIAILIVFAVYAWVTVKYVSPYKLATSPLQTSAWELLLLPGFWIVAAPAILFLLLFGWVMRQ